MNIEKIFTTVTIIGLNKESFLNINKELKSTFLDSNSTIIIKNLNLKVKDNWKL